LHPRPSSGTLTAGRPPTGGQAVRAAGGGITCAADPDALDLAALDCAAVDAEEEADLDAETPPAPTPSETVQVADPPSA